MLDGLIEKIIASKFGDYVSGLDKEHLNVGIWRGDIEVNNVQIKPQVVQRLKLPMSLKLGSIDQLLIKVPWQKLSSYPVQIQLIGLYIVLTPLNQSDWERDDDTDLFEKKEKILMHEARRLQKIENAEETLKSKGMVEKMMGKVIDNLQISIKNIHIRIEFPDFSAGFTLESLETFTTNDMWVKDFTDRYKKGKAREAIHKLLNINRISFYLETERKLIGREDLKQQMEADIWSELPYILKPLTAQAMIIHRSDLTDFTQPLYSVDINLPALKFYYTKQQFHSCVSFLEFTAHYDKFLRQEQIKLKYQVFRPKERNPITMWAYAIDMVRRQVRQQKNRLVNAFKIPKELLESYERDFKLIHRKFRKEQEVNWDELQVYNFILRVMKLDRVLEWTTHVASVVENEEKAEQEKKKSTSSWTSFFRRKEEEIKQTDEDYESLFTTLEEEEVVLAPPDYVWLVAKFALGTGEIMLQDANNGISFICEGVSTELYNRADSFDLSFLVNDCQLDLMESGMTSNICRKQSGTTGSLLNMTLFHKPQNINAENVLSLQSQPIEMTYNPTVIKQLISFFHLQNVHEVLATAAWDTVQELQDATQATASDVVHSADQIFDIHIAAPIIILPLANSQAKFMWNLGNLEIRNLEKSELYENFACSIKSVHFSYVDETSRVRNIITDLSIDFQLGFLKSTIRKQKALKYKTDFDENSDAIISGVLPKLDFEIDNEVYYKLISLEKVGVEQDVVYSEVLKNATLNGDTKKQGQTYKTWQKYKTVLKQGYLYFFTEMEEFQEYFYIKDCSISDTSADTQVDFCFELANRFGNCTLAFSTEEDSRSWTVVIKDAIADMSTGTSAAKTVNISSPLKVGISFDFQITEMELKTKTDEGEAWAALHAGNLQAKCRIRPYDTEIKAQMEEISLLQLSKTSNTTIARSDNQVGIITFLSCAKLSPMYEGEGLRLKLALGDLIFNWNSDILASLVSFLATHSDPPSGSELLAPDNVLIQGWVEIEKIELYLNNTKTEIWLGKASIERGKINFAIRHTGYYLVGDLGNLALYDLTDYPLTPLNRGVDPYLIFSVRDQSDVLLSFDIKIYEIIKDDIGSEVFINLNSAKFIYMHQITCRLIDFFNYEMLGIFDEDMRATGYFKTEYAKFDFARDKIKQAATTFTNITAKIDRPLIYFTPRPNHGQSLVLDLGNIEITNGHEWSETEEFQSCWLDKFNISFSGAQILHDNDPVSKPFDFLLKWDRPIACNKHYALNMFIDSVNVDLAQYHYNLFMKINDLNICYDDQLENLINPNPSPEYDGRDKDQHGGKFLTFGLTISNFNTSFHHGFEAIADASVSELCLNLTYYVDRYMELNMKAPVLSIHHEETNVFHENFKIWEPLTCDEESLPTLDFKMMRTQTGDKDISITLNQLRLILHLPVFQQLQNFFYYGLPKYPEPEPGVVHTCFDYMKLVESSKWVEPMMTVNVHVNSPIILFPIEQGSIAVVCQSNIQFMYFCAKSSVASVDAPQSLIKLNWSDTELYTCEVSEISSLKSFQTVQKRRLLEPLNFKMENGQYRAQDNYRFELAKIDFKLSHKDIQLLNHIIAYQNKLITTNKRATIALTGDEQEVDKPKMVHYESHGCHIVIINDAAGAYFPVFEINLGGLETDLVSNAHAIQFGTDVQLAFNWYNPFAGTWEPILEESTARIEYMHNEKGEPKTVIDITSSTTINFNFTENMCDTIYRVCKSWIESFQVEQEEEGNLGISAPIAIKNFTGYHMTVSKNKTVQTIVPGRTEYLELSTFENSLNSELNTENLLYELAGFGQFSGINANSVTSTTFRIGDSNNFIIADIALQGTRKIIEIRSQVLIENKSSLEFQVLFDKPDNRYTIQCGIGETVPVPIDYCGHPIGLLPMNEIDIEGWSNIDLANMMRQESGYFEEISTGNVFMIIQIFKSKTNTRANKIVIRAPISIRNALPFPITVTLANKTVNYEIEYTLQKNQNLSIHYASLGHALAIAAQIRNFSKSAYETLLNKTRKPIQKLTLPDGSGNSLELLVKAKHAGGLEFIIYAPMILVNNTSLPLDFYYKQSGKLKRVAGWAINKMLPAPITQNLQLGFDEEMSKSFRIGTVGARNVISLKNQVFTQCQFVYNVEIEMPVQDELVFTQIVTIAPRRIIVNSTSHDIAIQQPVEDSRQTMLHPGERVPFHAFQNEFVCFRVDNDWLWSGPMSIADIGEQVVQCKHGERKSEFFFIRADIKFNGISTFIILNQEIDSFSYKIRNNSQIISLGVNQFDCSHELRYVDCGSEIPFAWSSPLKPKKLIVEFYSGCLSLKELTNQKFCFLLDRLSEENQCIVELSPQHKVPLFWKIYSEGRTKVLQFSDTQEDRLLSDAIQTQFHVLIPELGISIVENGELSSEIVYILMKNIEYLALDTEANRKAELAVSKLSIDNQCNYKPLYPVLLWHRSSKKDARPMINLAYNYSLQSRGCFAFKKFQFLIQEFHVQLESNLLQRIYGIHQRLTDLIQERVLHRIYDELKSSVPGWAVDEIATSEIKFFFEKLEIHPIKIHFSFVPLSLEDEKFEQILKGMGMSLTSIDKAPIRINGLKVEDVFGSASTVLPTITTHYKSQFQQQIFSLVGYSDFLGNPVGLVSGLGTGVVDLFYEPVAGAVKGPISAGKGVLKGTGSLIQHTVEGTFGTVSKITGSMATGLTMLTNDKATLRERHAARKPKNVIEGVGLGVASLFKGIGKGVVGIVADPIMGAKKGGGKGFFTGILKGIGGLVTKPVAGALDVAGKTAEGIKNTPGSLIGNKDAKRSRQPRLLYGTNSVVKPYNKDDCAVMKYLMNKSNKYAKEQFVFQQAFKDHKETIMCLVLFTGLVLLIKLGRGVSIIWETESSLISQIQVTDTGIMLYGDRNKKGLNNFMIPCTNKDYIIKIYEMLHTVVII